MRLFQRSAVLPALLMLCFTGAVLSVPKQVDVADTRILIDVSGSMKKNDPKNLRRPALRLLLDCCRQIRVPGCGYLAVGSTWRYHWARWTNPGRNEPWRGADKIHSRGLFTNIEDVLRRSTEDWKGATTKYQRHLVLLTDGMVDVSKSRPRMPLRASAS